MANEPLKRNRYAYPPSQECRITGSNLNRDFDDYHLPHSRLALAFLQDWGVAQGLEVTGIIGNTEIAVNSGAALDGQGQLIWLASNGSGTLDINPPTKVPIPVKLNTSNYQRAEDTAYYLTITFFEWEQREVGRPCDRVLEQVPWIRLQPISGDGAYVDDGTSVVLGQVVIDAQGKLKELKTDGRRLVGKTVEQLQFRRADKAADQVQQVSAAKIKPAANGGLQITVPDANNKVLLEKEGGGNFTKLEVHTDTLDVAGNIKASELQGTRLQLSADGAIAGALTIQNDLSVSRNADIRGNLAVQNDLSVSRNADIRGNLKISGNLEVQGNVIARDTEHIAGNVSLGDADNDEVKITGVVRSGHSSGALRVDDTLHTTGSLTVDGNVGIGTTAPGAKLHVINTSQDANGNTLILGSTDTSNLRLGYHTDYSWIQSHGSKPLAINPIGNNIGIGTVSPEAKLHIFSSEPNLRLHSPGTRTVVQFARGGNLQWDLGVGLGSSDNKDFWFGDFQSYRLVLQKGTGNVGIGTTTPRAKLEVANGAIMPSAGNSENAGIMFPKDAFGGGGDAAWMRYYARSGESCTLEIGISNDGDDHLSLMPSGNVGIGTTTPSERLDVNGTIKANALKIGNTVIGEYQLQILKKLAAGQLVFDLYNMQQQEYLYAADYKPYDNDRRMVFTWRRKNERVNQGRWRLEYLE